MTDLGKVMVVPKGAYNANTTYEVLDLVTYNGSSYIALKSTKGNVPTNATYWQLHGQGYPGSAAGVSAKDTQGMVVTTGSNSTVQALIDAIADRVMTKLLAKTAIVQTESTATDKVPSSAYIKQALGTINSNLESKANADTVSGLSADLINVKESLNPLKTSLVGDINNNTAGVVNIVAWDSNTASTPKSTGNTIYGNGFCLTYSLGDQWLCQLAMAVGDSHLFTRYRREGVWSGWETK